MAARIMRKSTPIGTNHVRTPKTPERAVFVDYPQESENIIPGHYAVRIAAEPERRVEISINDAQWLECRFAEGYYWYDWNPEASGEFKIVARAHNGAGRPKRSTPRTCSVILRGERLAA